MWVHTCKRARPGPKRPYKRGPNPAVPQPLSAMSQAEPPLAETKPHGVRPHICCAPPPRAPTSLGSTPLLVRAEPRRQEQRPSQPADNEPCAAEQDRASPREPTDPYPSEPGGCRRGQGGRKGEQETGGDTRDLDSRRCNGPRGRGAVEALPQPGEEASPPLLPSFFAAPDGGWLSADESSGYESESAGGERAAAAGGTRGRQRRARTAFTSEQICRLEKTFQRQKYLGASERRKLAAALQLSEMQVGPGGSGSFPPPSGRASQARHRPSLR